MHHSLEWRTWFVTLLVLLGVTACSGSQGGVSIERPVRDPVFGSLPAEKSIEIGRRYYQHAQYGLAEQSFRNAVEQDHNNAEAWLGLAASYDRLRRFDSAKQAYDVLVKLVGRTPIVLNNLGYHYFLSGDRVRAREALVAALRTDPENEQIRDNLALVAGGKAATEWSPRVSPAP